MVDLDRLVEDAWLGVWHGRIAGRGTCANGAIAPATRNRIDTRGLWNFPGVVDGQVHSGSQACQKGLDRASRAAAVRGVTVMLDMPFEDHKPVASRNHRDRVRRPHNQMQELTRRNIARMSAAGDTSRGAFLRAHPPHIEDLATTALIHEIDPEAGVSTYFRGIRAHVRASTDASVCNEREFGRLLAPLDASESDLQ